MNKVEAITGAPFCWRVQSRSNPSQYHVVRWLDEPPSCSCNDWSLRHRQYEADTGKPYLCYHLREAKEFAWSDLIVALRDQV
mgnify:CR=1 FL=1